MVHLHLSLLQLMVIGAVLGVTWEQVCEPDLRPYLILYSVNLVAYFACTLYFHHAHTPVDINTLRYVSSEETRLDRFFKGFYEGARVSWLLITLYGGALLSNSTTCQNTSPLLFILTFILVAYNILIIVLPFILLFLFICSLPFLIIVARRFVSVNGAGHAGADQDTINAVPLHQYTATESHSYDGVIIAPADAKCIICLGPYKEDEEFECSAVVTTFTNHVLMNGFASVEHAPFASATCPPHPRMVQAGMRILHEMLLVRQLHTK